MGVLGFSIYFGCKWLTWWRAKAAGAHASTARSVGYLLAWPGMHAQVFLKMEAEPPEPTRTAWFSAILNTLFGAALLWGIARRVPPRQTLLAGWIGFVGLVFLSFFGISHVLALLWQRAGADAHPIMHAPVLARSPADFWGSRWNLAFREFLYDVVCRPTIRRLGTGGARLVTFLVSGLIHELVISVPAGGGYGLPTAYFVVQGIGVSIERSAFGKRWGLHQGLSGRLFTVLLTAGPVFWLFHPPFITRVIVPFMHVVAAL